MPVLYTMSKREATRRQQIEEEIQRRQRADALKKATIEVEKRMSFSPPPLPQTAGSSNTAADDEVEGMVDLLNGTSIERESGESTLNRAETEKKINKPIFPSLLRKDTEKRLLNAHTKIETVERKLDRELISAKSKQAEQNLMIHFLIQRLEEMEEKIFQTRRGLVYKPKSKLNTNYSPFVADRATQTRSENHTAEGVYVTVSRSNQIKERKVVSRTPSYTQPDCKLEEEKIVYLPTAHGLRPKSFNHTI